MGIHLKSRSHAKVTTMESSPMSEGDNRLRFTTILEAPLSIWILPACRPLTSSPNKPTFSVTPWAWNVFSVQFLAKCPFFPHLKQTTSANGFFSLYSAIVAGPPLTPQLSYQLLGGCFGHRLGIRLVWLFSVSSSVTMGVIQLNQLRYLGRYRWVLRGHPYPQLLGKCIQKLLHSNLLFNICSTPSSGCSHLLINFNPLATHLLGSASFVQLCVRNCFRQRSGLML